MTTASRSLEGRAALVTGASRGIGAAIAKELAANGAHVAITFLNSHEEAARVVGSITEKGGKAVAVQADHSTRGGSQQGVRDAVAALGSLDILVNNVGVGWIAPLTETSDERLEAMLNINLHGVVYTTQEAIRHLSDGGRIITTGSIVGTSVPYAGCSVYATSKAGLIGLTKALSRDLGPRGITVNIIEPGPVATEGTPPEGEFADMLVGFTSLGRFGTPQDVAYLAAWIASEQASFMTGSVVTLDGGWSA